MGLWLRPTPWFHCEARQGLEEAMTSLVDLALQLEAFLVWGSKRCCLEHGLDFQQQNVSEGFIILGVPGGFNIDCTHKLDVHKCLNSACNVLFKCVAIQATR